MPTNAQSTDKPQLATGTQHPEEWRQDLNPNAMAGQNLGSADSQTEPLAPTAYELVVFQFGI